jgi:hypothetical protein
MKRALASTKIRGRRAIAAVLVGLAIAAVPPTLAAAATSTTESGNPINDQGSNFHYRSNITSVTPNVPGLSLQVLEFADRLLLINHTGRTVTIYGYSGEPYARILANGAVEQNIHSPAVYLNTNFYANVTVPPSAAATDPPTWQIVDKTGQFEWHDHRIHWMSPVTPPQVKDKGKLTKIFNWVVPISVGVEKTTVNGELFWTPENSTAPVAAIVALAIIVIGAIGLTTVVRRRRSAAAAARPDGGSKEVW